MNHDFLTDFVRCAFSVTRRDPCRIEDLGKIFPLFPLPSSREEAKVHTGAMYGEPQVLQQDNA